jgi:hypothetical protein
VVNGKRNLAKLVFVREQRTPNGIMGSEGGSALLVHESESTIAAAS